MISIKYCEAITEVLDILAHTNKEDVNKISTKFMNFLRENASSEYKPNLDHSKRIKDLNLKEETIGLLSVINSKFWCNAKELEEFNNILKENENNYQENLRKLYNPTNIFKNKQINSNGNDMNLVTYKKITWYQKIFKKIKSIIK